MEAVTDVIFRHVVAKAGRPDVFFTEFTNATGWFRAGDKAIGGRLVKTDDENPIVAQLWGSDKEAMASMASHCVELGYDGIDINMGCPDQSAIKGGGGAQMIRTPELAYAIISAAKSSGLPISVKTRLGYSHIDEWHDWLRGLLEQDISALTIHLRTKKEMSKVPAHFELIPEIIALRNEVAPQTLIIINGDIRDRLHGIEFATKYGVDGVMIGRGVFQNPFCFEKPVLHAQRVARGGAAPAETLNVEEGADRATGPAASDLRSEAYDGSGEKRALINLLHYHLDLYDQYSSITHRPFETLKRFFKIYIRNFDGASDIRDQLMHCQTTDEVRQILTTIGTDY